MEVLFFGRLGGQFGQRLEIDPPGEGWTVADLRRALCLRDERLREALEHPGVRACVDQQIVPEDTHLQPNQEVAFIPPLSGG